MCLLTRYVPIISSNYEILLILLLSITDKGAAVLGTGTFNIAYV